MEPEKKTTASCQDKTTKTARSQLPFLQYAKNLDVTGALKEIATV